ncbi:uncharacterized protein LOC125500283 [Athalia rosae]|uniref:uncharacterized protein LOC125500283 n=1 Tax=Athalia rosae TaxID=37344 RepID=UPI002034A12A|nr:uncharacterized protein LOC125500283 [Athalia rosae]
MSNTPPILRPTELQEWKTRATQQITVFLQNVKGKLMSGALEEQKKAIDCLMSELYGDSGMEKNLLFVVFLKSEIITLLCEITLAMRSWSLVTSTLKCLESLTTCDQFYKQTHASYVVASILRAGYFLKLENVTEEKRFMLESIANTLARIFEGAALFRVLPETICEINRILEFFSDLITRETQSAGIIFSTAKILSIVLRSKHCDKTNKVTDKHSDVVSIVTVTLNLMSQMIDEPNSTDAHVFRSILMTCAVCATVITLCDAANNHSIDAKCRTDLAYCIYSSMMKTVIPNFNRIELDEKNGAFYTWFVSCLIGIYDLEFCDTRELSDYLALQGFLQTLSHLTTISPQNFRNETLLLLSKILTSLATVSLSANTWPGGAKQFQKFLFIGFKCLPPDPSSWISTLKEGDDRADALLVLFYYHLHVRMGDAARYLEIIVAYIISASSSKIFKRKSITVEKALWFIFCIAAVSHEKPSSINLYDAASNQLFKSLENTTDLGQYYTHHPAVVIHSLQNTEISDKLRAEIFCLWLDDGGDVESLVEAAPEMTSCCLMGLVRTGTVKKVEVAAKAIFEMANSVGAVKELIGDMVWDILPQMIASSDENHAHNTIMFLKLASSFKPKEMSGDDLIRSLYQLIKFILKNESDMKLISLGITEAHILLEQSIRREDLRGVLMFTTEPSLIRVLKSHAFAKEDAALSYTCFYCLSSLIECQAKHSVHCESSLNIRLEDLLEQLFAVEFTGALRFTVAMFADVIEKPVISFSDLFSDSNSDKLIRRLYLQLHVIHAKGTPEDRDLSYKALTGLLERCSAANHPNTLKNLCDQPWTYVLIKMTIEGDRITDPFMQFLSKWFNFRFSVSPVEFDVMLNDQKLCKDQFEITLDLVGKAALNLIRKRMKTDSLSKLLQSLMLYQDLLTKDLRMRLSQLAEQRPSESLSNRKVSE